MPNYSVKHGFKNSKTPAADCLKKILFQWTQNVSLAFTDGRSWSVFTWTSNIRLYRDDGLGLFRNMSDPEVERKKKYLIRIFKSNRLSINLKVADFLDIHFEI